jgi:hypothetical protein
MDPHDYGDTPETDRTHDDSRTVTLSPGDPVAMSVVRAVATAVQRPPLDLEPLSTQVDPEALETLVTGPVGSREGLRISFRFAGCHVAVTPARITVAPGGAD